MKLRWYLHRMRAMSAGEVQHRVIEKYRHATQRQHFQKIRTTSWDATPTGTPHLPDPATAPPVLRQQLAEDASRLLQGQWQLFGWKNATVGTPPSWHLDPISGIVIDASKPSHHLNHRHLPDGADARTLWEINRWAELTRLAMHGWLNQDPAAIRTAQLWLGDWCDRNPTGHGINWTSPLEGALRLLNFCWFDALARATTPNDAAITQAQDTLVARIVPAHAAWIWRYRSTGSSANNHLLGELAALVVAAARWPGLAKFTCTAQAAWEDLGSEVLHQFAGDGGSREQALHYHLFAFDLAWQAANAVNCCSGPVHDRLTQAALFFRDMAPDAEPWDFGDSDDAQVLPFALHRAEAAGEWKSWLCGEGGSLNFWLGRPPLPLPSESIHAPAWTTYPETGMAVCDQNGWKLRLDASPLGFGPLAAHGHGDAMHLSIWDGRAAIIVDPGTGGYFGAPELRARLASWTVHNTPQPIHGFKTPRRIGAFLLVQHHAPPSLVVDDDAARAELRHEGHVFQRNVRAAAEVIEITDHETAGRPFQILWQFAPECHLTPLQEGDLSRLRITRGNREWQLQVDAESSTLALIDTSVSPAFGQIEKAVALKIICTTGTISTTLTRLS